MYGKSLRKRLFSLFLILFIAGTCVGEGIIGFTSNLNKDDARIEGFSFILGDKMLRFDENASEKELASCSGLIILKDDGKVSPEFSKRIKAFAARGNIVFMDMNSFAAMNGIEPESIDVSKKSNTIVTESPATCGFKAQDPFPVISKNGQMSVVSKEEIKKCGMETLVAVDDNYSSFVRKKEGNGFIYAFDILSVAEPFYKDSGSFYKYLIISNLFGNPIKYGQYYSSKLSYSEFVGRMEKLSGKYPELILKEEGTASGNLKIYSFNIGNPDAPLFFMHGAVHGNEWEPAYGLLSFAEKLAAGEFKDKIDLKNISFKIIPIMNPYGYEKRSRKNKNKVDLNRQGDVGWDALYSDSNKDGKYDEKDEYWKGNGGPFSEPEAAIYKEITDNAKNLYFVLDLHGNLSGNDNFLCICYMTGKADNFEKAVLWSSLMNESLKGRYILQQMGDKKAKPYLVKKPVFDKTRPVLIKSSVRERYGFALELSADYKNSIATCMVSDIVCASILSIMDVYAPDPHAALLADIKNGKLATVHAKWWNPGKDDATQALQSAINSGAKQVIIDNIGYDWIVDPVFLVDNQEIILDKDVTVMARKGGFKGVRDSLFSATGRKNIKIRGSGNSVLRMHKADYLDPRQYKQGEWRHTLSLLSCENVEISDLTLKSSGGDGIYVSVDYNNPAASKYCKNVTIENVVCDDHNRQGISVISAENLFIRKSVFKKTKGAAPMDGIDLEPNASSERLVNCVIEDCDFSDNSKAGIELYLVNLTDKSEPVSVTVRNTKISGNNLGIKLSLINDASRHPAGRGKVKFENCSVDNSVLCPLTIRNWSPDSAEVIFENCTFDAGTTISAGTPIVFVRGPGPTKDIGGIKFERLTVIDKIERDIFCFKSWASGDSRNITGDLRLILNGKATDMNIADIVEKLKKSGLGRLNTKVAELESEKLVPQGDASMSEARSKGKRLILRGKITLLQWAEKGQKVLAGISLIPIGNSPESGNVKVKSPSGRTETEFKVPFDGKEHVCEFNAAESGVYRLEANPGREQMTYNPGNSSYGILLNPDGLNLRQRTGRLYFQVPSGVKNFSVEVFGCWEEPFDAVLLDSNMKVVKKKDYVEAPYSFEIAREDATDSEIWAVEFNNAVDDVFVKFYSPLVPVVSNSKENLLVTK